tara:strand:+ start:254 stop:1027 length:774 start_codon:yes stop_codon:yes gene_type:complete
MLRFFKSSINSLLKLINLKIINIDSSFYINKKELFSFDNNNSDYQLYLDGLIESENKKSDNSFKQSRFLDLINLVKFTLNKNEIEDFVEIGCWRGHSSYVISSLIRKFSKKNINFHIFDSFEGLSDKSKFDKNLSKFDNSQLLKIRNQFKSDEDFVKNKVLGDFNFVNTYKGWIPDKFHILENKRFSLVHIDVDLYEPTLKSLKFFFPKLIDGGVIICDDYNSKVFDGAKKACDEYFKEKNFSFSFKPATGSFFVIK